ncbi:ABC transporter ATP-binding protein [Paenibacillus filicis]|uniref:ABC transporter ATP-binding protein n=1 Tax=Paenibacillus gyeongsangnamensis TaxID=3388067 RepID=A0ABT4Q6P8_9BACL|nr:ABC transporter ATP-binding protein [Paenibacillus filicis]MCZ8512553.1 ABC transporter ATP-binding protein [Paenibacillus filicis]
MIVIETFNVTKDFRIIDDKPKTLKDKILRINKKAEKKIFRALDNVSVSIQEGDVVGLVGRNGSGKSTLLKLFSRIIFPTEGSINIKGRVCSLLELGAGFHPDFNGIENIYMNASLFGLSKKDITEKLDDIIGFSELGEFIYRPIRTYSSGMYMRLAFSVAISVDPDILLIDEVLAVGDSAFQQKCINRISELKSLGKTIVIVTHDHSIVEKLCNYSIWLKNGVVKAEGHPKEVIIQYLNDLADEENNRLNQEEDISVTTLSNTPINENQDFPVSELSIDASVDRWGNKKVRIHEINLLNKQGEKKRNFRTGESLIIEMNYEIMSNNKNISFGIGLFRNDGLCCYGTNTDVDKIDCSKISTNGIVKFIVDSCEFLPGEYWLDVAVHSKEGEPYDYIVKAKKFMFFSERNDIGVMRVDHKWEIT